MCDCQVLAKKHGIVSRRRRGLGENMGARQGSQNLEDRCQKEHINRMTSTLHTVFAIWYQQ